MSERIWVKKPGEEPQPCREDKFGYAVGLGYQRCDPPGEAKPSINIDTLEEDATKKGGRQKLEQAAKDLGVPVSPKASKAAILDKVKKKAGKGK